MLNRQAFTLMEIVVVLIIIAVVAVIAFPNFITPMEQGRAAAAQNNLLAIYTAEQNYNNNNGGNGVYCVTGTAPNPCDSLAHINTAFSLNIDPQLDNTYAYSCAGVTCTATRINTTQNLVITMALNKPIQLTGEVNPSCASNTGNANWCP